jgi:two-component system OmpR family sensor kinase
MTLRGRLARFYAVTIALMLGAFAATVWAILEAQEAREPLIVSALEPPEQFGTHLLVALAASLPVALAIAIGGAAVIARRGLKPLDDVVALAGRVGAERLDERLPERDGAVDEARRLTASLNAMLERIERSVAGMRRFTADASHELRTPLSALRAELELALTRERSPEELRATVERSLEQLDRLQRLVEALLQLARSDAGALPVQPAPTDLVALARSVVEPYEPLLQARKVALAFEGAPSLRALADPLWTGRAIANLVDNASRFAPDGGAITIALASENGRALVEVRDTGPGVAAAELERIFERFHRGSNARATTDGTGLGLPLAREIARAQHGDLTAAPGEGGRFVLSLPLA